MADLPPLSLAATRAALAAYDAGAADREERWRAATTKAELEAIDREAAAPVREAFANDTAHVNSRDHAFLVHPDDPWLRRLVAAHA